MDWIEGFTTEQRDGLMLALGYEKVRCGHQRGYKAWPKLDPVILESATFKTAITVAAWLKSKAGRIVWNEVR